MISKRKVTQVAIQGESKEGQFCESRIHVPYQEGHSFECFLIFEGFDFKQLISFSNLQNFLNDLVLNEDAVFSVQQLTPKIVLSVGVSFFFLICGGKSFCRSHTDCVLL